MNYITKKEVKNILEIELNELFSIYGFQMKKSQNKFIKVMNNGFVMFVISVNDDFNLMKDEVCWKIDVNFFIRFNIVHEWFETFDLKENKDLKNVWTIGENIYNKLKYNLTIDVNELNAKQKIRNLAILIKDCFFNFYQANNELEKINKALLPTFISKLEDITGYKYLNVNYTIVILSLAKIFNREDFHNIIKITTDKIKQLSDVGDPMAKMYIDKFEDIILKLKLNKFDFSGQNLQLDW